MTKQQQGFYEKLHALARNYWWCWQPEVVAIFRDLEPIRWRELDHNPVLLCSGSIRVGCVDMTSLRPAGIPDSEFRKIINTNL